MIIWEDDAIVLAARPHGETAAVVQLLTRERGRHAGLVQGGQGRRVRPLLQPGNQVRATWRARLADHLGNYTLEAMESHAARFLDRPERLAALSAAVAVCEEALPEREAHQACHDGLLALIAALDGDHWAETYVQWELLLLRDLGFGLDLSGCAAGGANDQLAYVSPRSGRAVSLAGGEPYRDRLLALPGFLVGRGGGGPSEVAQGLQLTGHFLARQVFHPRERELPAARQRLRARFPALDAAR
jgi:DNA repair protein RecO (recombination protein O)